jgi:uncharacterized protein (DUF433 family)
VRGVTGTAILHRQPGTRLNSAALCVSERHAAALRDRGVHYREQGAARKETLLLNARSRIMDNMTANIISTSPDIMSGTPVFAGTRVPIQALIDCLEAGESIDDFLEGFPTVSREQVIAFLEEAKNRMIVSSN